MKRSSLLAAMRMGKGAAGVLVGGCFCSSKRMECRYSAAWRRPLSSLLPPLEADVELEGERSAASTINIIPFRFLGLVMLSNA